MIRVQDLVFAPVVLLALAVPVTATDVLGFDDLTDDLVLNAIPSGHGNLQWTNFALVRNDFHEHYPHLSNSGYGVGTLSPRYVASNHGEGWAEIYSPQPWDFLAATFTSAWKINQTLTLEAYIDNQPDPLYTRHEYITALEPSALTFAWHDINRLRILAYHDDSTTSANYGAVGDFFALDNFHYNAPVPEPSAGVIFLAAGVFSLRRRRR